MTSFAEMVVRLLLAMAMGGIVGLEREQHERPAGLRTHMIVCVGSALVTLVSIHFGVNRSDPARIAAQIVSGIGFLGAGTIFRAGSVVRGLTTAAGLWVVAGIGMAIAAGGDLLLLGVITALLVFAANMWLRMLEDRLSPPPRDLRVRMARGQEAMAGLLAALEERRASVQQVMWETEAGNDQECILRMRVRVSPRDSRGELTAALSGQPGVRAVEWDR